MIAIHPDRRLTPEVINKINTYEYQERRFDELLQEEQSLKKKKQNIKEYQ